MEFKKLRTLFLLFKITFSISSFTFGGGYIVIPMMRRYFVNGLELITEDELLDIAAIAQSTPGAIAVNIAVLIGYRIAGITGAAIACIGTVMPPLLILSFVSMFYKAFRDNMVISAVLKGMEAGIAATIVDLLINMWQRITKQKDWLLTLMVPAAFFANYILNINVALIIISSSILTFGQTYIGKKLKKKGDLKVE